MVKTTVVIPNLNGIKYLNECIAHVLRSKAEVDVIVVDNGSTDGSIEALCSTFPEVRVIELGYNTGFCHAVNVGIANAKTPYVFLLNDDAYVTASAIGRLEKVLDADPMCFSVQAKMLKMFEKDLIDSAGDEYCALGWAFPKGQDSPNGPKYKGKIKSTFSACGGAALYRRSLFKKIGLFDENHFAYLEDVDIGYRAMIYGYHNKIDLGAVVYHAGSQTTGSRHNDFKVRSAAKNNIYLLYKNMPFWQFVLNLPLIEAGIIIKFIYFIRKGLGKSYFVGLMQGIGISLSKKGRAQKVKYCAENLPNYIAIQVLLYINIVRRFLK